MSIEIGRIVKVQGIKVRAELNDKLPQYMINNGNILQSPQINSFLKTRVGFDIVICQIVGEFLEDNFRKDIYNNKFEKNNEKYCVELEIRGRFSKGKFYSGLRVLPFVGAKVYTLNERDYQSLNGINTNGEKSISLGKSVFDESKIVSVSVNKLIPSHIGIFGNTGSGKSNTLSKLVKEYIDCLSEYENVKNRIKVMIFDLNNEYGEKSIVSNKKLITFSTRKKADDNCKLKISYGDFDEEDWGIIANAREKTQMPVIKNALRKLKNNLTDERLIEYAKNEIKRAILSNQNKIYDKIRSNFNDQISGLEKIVYDYGQYKLGGLKLSAENFPDFSVKIPTKYLEKFLFVVLIETARNVSFGTNYDYISPMIVRLETRISDFEKVFIDAKVESYQEWFDNNNLLILQLGNVNKDMQEIISALLLKKIFDTKCKEKDEKSIENIVNVIIDEAHNLLSEDYRFATEIHDSNLKIYEKVIKEGRKFGLYLWISSQRPSDISSTITSQLHNYFIHRLVNPNDIERIRKAVSFMGEDSLNMLTVLGAGECIASGTAFSMPEFISIEELSPDEKPRSNDIKIFGKNGILENEANV